MARRWDSAGQLRHRISIEALERTEDDAGGVTEEWVAHVSAFASIMPIGASEAFKMGAVQGSVSHRVRMRYQSGVVPSMRVVHASRAFLITGVRNLSEESRWLELDCVEERV